MFVKCLLSSFTFIYSNYYRRLLELQNDTIIPGVRSTKRIQFQSVRLGKWDCPSQLNKCYWTEYGKFNFT